jgi:predicted RNase H-like nuclease (RuvC/YqgF family)
MNHKELVIVGIDPGTTVGYALLDMKGIVLEVKSSKEYSLNALIEEITTKAIPVVVGTDKEKVPGFVDKFSIKVGARLVSPQKDLLVTDKRLSIKSHVVRNSHELDALASAFFAYRNIKPLLVRIEDFLKEHHKEHLSYSVKKLVLTENVPNIKTAVELLEKKEEKELSSVKTDIEEKSVTEEDFWVIYNELEQAKKARFVVMQQNESYKKELENMKQKYQSLSKQIGHLVSEERRQDYLEHKEDRIQSLQSMAKGKDDEINELNKEIILLRDFLASLSEYILLKKLPTLSWNEFQQLNKVLQIKPGDILMVEDPNIFSYQTLNYIKGKVELIITKKQPNNIIREELSCGILSGNGMALKEEKYFALAKKDELEKLKKEKSMLHRVLDEYKKNRNLP